MKLKVLAFGIAKDIVGGLDVDIEVGNTPTVKELKEQLLANYPKFEQLASLAIAVNNEYAQDNLPITSSDEIVLIPPVSGG